MEMTLETTSAALQMLHVKHEDLQRQLQDTKAQLNTYEKRCEQYAQAYEQLQHQLKELLRYRFGKKSERFVEDEQPQLGLFENKLSPPIATEDSTITSNEDVQVTGYSRRKKNPAEKNIAKRVEIIPVNEVDKQCRCGACKTVIRYETKFAMHHQPEVFEVVEQRREVVACPKGCDGAMVTAPAPLQVLPKVKATEEFLSFLVVSKCDDRQPLYHLERQLRERYGIDCSRQTMARWLIELMTPLQPVFNLFKDHVIDYDIASCDPTSLQVL